MNQRINDAHSLKPPKVLFIGLGVMGGPMAGHLAQSKDIELLAYNRGQTRALKWQQKHGAYLATSLKEAAALADVIISCVSNDQALYNLLEQTLAVIKKDAIWIDHSTTSYEIALEAQKKLASSDAHFVDAPISGGEQGAIDGTLSVMLGAKASVFARCISILEHYSKSQTRIGPVGHGQLCKMVNQICIAGLLQGLSEAMHFLEQSNLDSKQVIEAIGSGAAQSWQMNNRAHTMLERSFDFGFAVDLMSKDLDLCLTQAKNIRASLPVTALVRQYYGKLQASGEGALDTSSLIKLL